MAITINSFQNADLIGALGQATAPQQEAILDYQQQQNAAAAASMASNPEQPREVYLSLPELTARVEMYKQLGERQAYLQQNNYELAKEGAGGDIVNDANSVLAELNAAPINEGQKSILLQAYAEGRSQASASLNGSNNIDGLGIFFRNLLGGAATAATDMGVTPLADNEAVAAKHKAIQDWVQSGYTYSEREQARHSAGLQSLAKDIYSENLLDVGADYANRKRAEKSVFGAWTTTDWAANIGQGAGSLVPLILTSLVSGGIAGAVTGTTKAGLAAMNAMQRATALKNANILRTALGTAAETAMIAGANGQSVYDSVMMTPTAELEKGSPAYVEMVDYYQKQGYSPFDAQMVAKKAIAKSASNLAWFVSLPAATMYRGFGAVDRKLSDAMFLNKLNKAVAKGTEATTSTEIGALRRLGAGAAKATGKAMVVTGKMLKPAIAEGIQEANEQYLANFSEKAYNENVDVNKDVIQSATLGAIVGGGHNTIAATPRVIAKGIQALRGTGTEQEANANVLEKAKGTAENTNSDTNTEEKSNVKNDVKSLADVFNSESTESTEANNTDTTTLPTKSGSTSTIVQQAVEDSTTTSTQQPAAPVSQDITPNNFQENIDRGINKGDLKNSFLNRALFVPEDDSSIRFSEEVERVQELSNDINDIDNMDLNGAFDALENGPTVDISPSQGIKRFINDLSEYTNITTIADRLKYNINRGALTVDELVNVEDQIHSLQQLAKLKQMRDTLPRGMAISDAANDVLSNLSDEDLSNLNIQLDKILAAIAQYRTNNNIPAPNRATPNIAVTPAVNLNPEASTELQLDSSGQISTGESTDSLSSDVSKSNPEVSGSSSTISGSGSSTPAKANTDTEAEQQDTKSNGTNTSGSTSDSSDKNSSGSSSDTANRTDEDNKTSSGSSSTDTTDRQEDKSDTKPESEKDNYIKKLEEENAKLQSQIKDLAETQEKLNKQFTDLSSSITDGIKKGFKDVELKPIESKQSATKEELVDIQKQLINITGQLEENKSALEAIQNTDNIDEIRKTVQNLLETKQEKKDTEEDTTSEESTPEVPNTTVTHSELGKDTSDIKNIDSKEEKPSQESTSFKQDVNAVSEQNKKIQNKYNIFRVAISGWKAARRVLGRTIGEVKQNLKLKVDSAPTKSESEDKLIHLTVDQYRTLSDKLGYINVDSAARAQIQSFLDNLNDSNEELTKADLDKLTGLDEFAKEQILQDRSEITNLIPVGQKKLFKLLADNNGKIQIVAPNENERVITLTLLDTETSGLIKEEKKSAFIPEITNLGMVQVTYSLDRGAVLSIDNIYSKYNEPEGRIDAEASKVTGLTKRNLKGYKIDYDEVRSFLGDLNKNILVAYNAKFDRSILEGNFARYLTPSESNEIINNAYYADAYQQIFWDRNSETETANSKLETIVGELGYAYPAHGALFDVLGMLQLGIEQPKNFGNLIQNSVNPTIEFVLQDDSLANKEKLEKELGFTKKGSKYSLSVSGLHSASIVESKLNSKEFNLFPGKNYYVYTIAPNENNVYTPAREIIKKNNPILNAMLSENPVDTKDMQTKLETKITEDGTSLREAVLNEYDSRNANNLSKKNVKELGKIVTNYDEFSEEEQERLQKRDNDITKRVSNLFINNIQKTITVFGNTFFNSSRLSRKVAGAIRSIIEELSKQDKPTKYNLSAPISQVFNQKFLSNILLNSRKIKALSKDGSEVTLGAFLNELEKSVNKVLAKNKEAYEALGKLKEDGKIPVFAIDDTLFINKIASTGILEEAINDLLIDTGTIENVSQIWNEFEEEYKALVHEAKTRNKGASEAPMTVSEFVNRLTFINKLPDSLKEVLTDKIGTALAYSNTKLISEIHKANKKEKAIKSKKKKKAIKPTIISIEGIEADVNNIEDEAVRERLKEEYTNIYENTQLQSLIDEIKDIEGWENVQGRPTNIKDSIRIMIESLFKLKTYNDKVHNIYSKILSLLPTSTTNTLEDINNTPFTIDTTPTNSVNAGGNIHLAPVTRANVQSNSFLQRVFRKLHKDNKVVSITQQAYDLEDNVRATRDTENTPASKRESAKWRNFGVNAEALINANARGILADLPKMLNSTISLDTEEGIKVMSVQEALANYPAQLYKYGQGEYSILSLLTQTANGFEFTPSTLERLSAVGVIAMHELRKRMQELEDEISFENGDVLNRADNLTIERIRAGLSPEIQGLSEIEVLDRIAGAVNKVFNITATEGNETQAKMFTYSVASFVLSAMNNGVLTSSDSTMKNASKPYFQIKRVEVSYVDEATNKTKSQYINYLCPTMENTNRTNRTYSNVLSIPTLIGSHDNLVYNILGENSEENAPYSLERKSTPNHIRNTDINLTSEQKATQERAAKQGMYIDTDMADVFIAFAEDYNNQDEHELTESENKYLPFRQRAARNSRRNISTRCADMLAYISNLVRSREPDATKQINIPVYTNAQMTRINRIQLDAPVNPVANPELRTILSPAGYKKLNLKNPKIMWGFRLALAQNFDISTDGLEADEINNQLDTITNRLDEMIADPKYKDVFKNLKNTTLYNLVTTRVKTENNEEVPFFDVLWNTEIAYGNSTFTFNNWQAITAALTYFKYKAAELNGTTGKFQTTITYKIDGTTNGTYNATTNLGHMIISRLKQSVYNAVGWFFGRASSKNEHKSKGGSDIYTLATRNMATQINKELNEIKDINRRLAIISLLQVFYKGQYTFSAQTAEGQQIIVESVARDLAKHPTIATSYASSKNGILETALKEAEKRIVSSVSKVSVNIADLSEALKTRTNEEITNTLDSIEDVFTLAVIDDIYNYVQTNQLTASEAIARQNLINFFSSLYTTSTVQASFNELEGKTEFVNKDQAFLAELGKLTKISSNNSKELNEKHKAIRGMAVMFEFSQNIGSIQSATTILKDPPPVIRLLLDKPLLADYSVNNQDYVKAATSFINQSEKYALGFKNILDKFVLCKDVYKDFETYAVYRSGDNFGKAAFERLPYAQKFRYMIMGAINDFNVEPLFDAVGETIGSDVNTTFKLVQMIGRLRYTLSNEVLPNIARRLSNIKARNTVGAQAYISYYDKKLEQRIEERYKEGDTLREGDTLVYKHDYLGHLNYEQEFYEEMANGRVPRDLENLLRMDITASNPNASEEEINKLVKEEYSEIEEEIASFRSYMLMQNDAVPVMLSNLGVDESTEIYKYRSAVTTPSPVYYRDTNGNMGLEREKGAPVFQNIHLSTAIANRRMVNPHNGTPASLNLAIGDGGMTRNINKMIDIMEENGMSLDNINVYDCLIVSPADIYPASRVANLAASTNFYEFNPFTSLKEEMDRMIHSFDRALSNPEKYLGTNMSEEAINQYKIKLLRHITTKIMISAKAYLSNTYFTDQTIKDLNKLHSNVERSRQLDVNLIGLRNYVAELEIRHAALVEAIRSVPVTVGQMAGVEEEGLITLGGDSKYASSLDLDINSEESVNAYMQSIQAAVYSSLRNKAESDGTFTTISDATAKENQVLIPQEYTELLQIANTNKSKRIKVINKEEKGIVSIKQDVSNFSTAMKYSISGTVKDIFSNPGKSDLHTRLGNSIVKGVKYFVDLFVGETKTNFEDTLRRTLTKTLGSSKATFRIFRNKTEMLEYFKQFPNNYANAITAIEDVNSSIVAFFNPSTNEIIWDKESEDIFTNNKGDADAFSKVIAHEVVHSLTTQNIYGVVNDPNFIKYAKNGNLAKLKGSNVYLANIFDYWAIYNGHKSFSEYAKENSINRSTMFTQISEFVADSLLGDLDLNMTSVANTEVKVTKAYWNNALYSLGIPVTKLTEKESKKEESKAFFEALQVTSLAYMVKVSPEITTIFDGNILAYSDSLQQNIEEYIEREKEIRNKNIPNDIARFAIQSANDLQGLSTKIINAGLDLTQEQATAFLQRAAIISYNQERNAQGNLVLDEMANKALNILEKKMPKVYKAIRNYTIEHKDLKIKALGVTTRSNTLRISPQAIVAALATVSSEVQELTSNITLSAPKKGKTDSTINNLSIYAGNYLMQKLIPKELNSDLPAVLQELTSVQAYMDSRTYMDYVSDVVQHLEKGLHGFTASVLEHTPLRKLPKLLSSDAEAITDTRETFNPANNGRNIKDSRKLQDDFLNTVMKVSTGNSYLDDIIKGLAKDITGRTPSTQRILSKVKQAKQIQGERMRLRIRTPIVLKRLFAQSKNRTYLTNEQDKALFTVFTKMDLSSFKDVDEAAKYVNMSVDELRAEANSILDNVNKYYFNNRKDLEDSVKKLAIFLTDGIALHGMYRNALQIALNIQKSANNPNIFIQKPLDINAINQIDKLVSILCLINTNLKSKEAVKTTQELLAYNENATKSVMQITMNVLNENKRNVYSNIQSYLEDGTLNKNNMDYSIYNHTKGYLGLEAKTNFQIYADKDSIDVETNLAKYGWKLHSRVNNVPGYAFYTREFNDKATFSQGGVQIINRAALGARIDDPSTSLGVGFTRSRKDINTYLSLTNDKEELEALPIYNNQGEVVGLEFIPPIELIEKQQRTDTITEAISISYGRQLEIRYASTFNKEIVNMLRDAYANATPKEKKNYVDVFTLKDNVIKDALNEMPTNVKAYIYESDFDGESTEPRKFKNIKETPPKLYVRKDLVEDIIGERAFSISELYSNKTMHKTTAKLFNTLINIGVRPIFKDNTYKVLIESEQTMQAVVLAAKNSIIVRSVIVPVANALANAFQLYCEGVPLSYIKKKIPEKVREIEMYVRYQNKLLDLSIKEQLYNVDSGARKNIAFEREKIENTIKKMSIYPLIEAGEFSSVVNVGESIEDGLLYSGELDKFLTKASSYIPEGTPRHIAENLLLTPNSPLYQGLLKAVQYTDLVSKAILYDHLTQNKLLYTEEALRRVSDAFIDYDRKGSRARMYAESIGLLWFWNFKLRILKSAIALIRNRPLLALFITSNPFNMGIGNPITDNIVAQTFNGTLGYSIGPGMIASGLMMHPAATLVNGGL